MSSFQESSTCRRCFFLPDENDLQCEFYRRENSEKYCLFLGFLKWRNFLWSESVISEVSHRKIQRDAQDS